MAGSIIPGAIEVRTLSINIGPNPQGQILAQKRVAVPGTRLYVVPGKLAIVEVTAPEGPPHKITIGEFPIGPWGWEYEVK